MKLVTGFILIILLIIFVVGMSSLPLLTTALLQAGYTVGDFVVFCTVIITSTILMIVAITGGR